jgi:Tfp pilus assembly protein PilE
MKQIKKHNRGTTFILLLIVVLVVGLWIVTVADQRNG